MTEEFWTQDRVAKLRIMWDGEDNTTQIGEALGCSKSAIIGKAYRLGLPLRGLARRPRPPILPVLPLWQRQLANTAGRCMYPIGHLETGNLSFCSKPVKEAGTPYCQNHHDLCYIPTAKLRV